MSIVTEAYLTNDRLRTDLQLQLEALWDAVGALDKAKWRYHTQQACDALLTLAQEQRKAVQP